MGLVILGAVADDELSKADEREKHSPAAPKQKQSFGALRHYVPQDILDVSFPASVRGYDRRAVDAYIERVNREIAELKVSASPPAAVRHALEQAGEKVQGLLQAAREAAEEITASARQEAQESTARAKAEAAEFVVNTSAEADRVKAEADELIANARTEADETLAKAKAEAAELLADTRAEAHNTSTTSARWQAASSIWPMPRLPGSRAASPPGRRKRRSSLRWEIKPSRRGSRRMSPPGLSQRWGPTKTGPTSLALR